MDTRDLPTNTSQPTGVGFWASFFGGQGRTPERLDASTDTEGLLEPQSRSGGSDYVTDGSETMEEVESDYEYADCWGFNSGSPSQRSASVTDSEPEELEAGRCTPPGESLPDEGCIRELLYVDTPRAEWLDRVFSWPSGS